MKLRDRLRASARDGVVAAALAGMLAAAYWADSRRPAAAPPRETPAPAAATIVLPTVVLPPPTKAVVASEPPAAGIRLDLSVRVACDEEFRRGSDWERRVRLRVDQASEGFEKRFGIRWHVQDFVQWKSDDAAPALTDLLEQLDAAVSPDGADVVLGFTGQRSGSGGTGRYLDGGRARYLGRCAVLASTGDEGDAQWRRGALVHELGHLLGAWHSSSKKSVMFEGGDRETCDDFDPQSAAMIEMVRDAGFPRDVEWIDAPRRARIAEIFRGGHAPDELLPTVAFAVWRGESMLAAGVPRVVARARLLDGLREQEECVGPIDPSLVKCLMALVRADRDGDAAERDEAARMERRASDIVVASNRAHRQNKPRDERAPLVPK